MVLQSEVQAKEERSEKEFSTLFASSFCSGKSQAFLLARVVKAGSDSVDCGSQRVIQVR